MNVGLRRRLALVPTEPAPPVFECAQAQKNLRAKYWKASRTTDAEWPPAQPRVLSGAAPKESDSQIVFHGSSKFVLQLSCEGRQNRVDLIALGREA